MSAKILVLTAVASAKLLPGTLFLSKHRKFRATYKYDGTERPISKTLMQRFYEVLNDLKVPAATRSRIKIFSVHDINTFHAGTTTSTYGALIGIPPSYEYESIEDAGVGQVDVHDRYGSWSVDTTDKFLECLVLSENAQKFAIAREVSKVQRFEFWIEAFIISMDCFFMFVLYDLIYKTGHFAKRARIQKLALQAVCGILTVFMCLMTTFELNTHADEEITEQLAKLGPEYVQGGKEFYEKLCELQEIRSKANLGFFTKLWMQNKYSATSHQKEFLALKLQELETVTM